MGELRGRASRMEPIAGVSELQPVLQSLKEKGLVLPLTPDGRGHVVTHALYSEREMERLKQRYAGGGTTAAPIADGAPRHNTPTPPAAEAAASAPSVAQEVVDAIAGQLDELRSQVTQLKSDLDDLTATCRQTDDELQRLKGDLGV